MPLSLFSDQEKQNMFGNDPFAGSGYSGGSYGASTGSGGSSGMSGVGASASLLAGGPLGIAIMGAGALIKSYGQFQANMAQSQAEAENAAFYREQAEFAEETGRRQLAVHEDQTTQIFGRQEAGIAKEGLGAGSAARLRGNQQMQRTREAGSIQREADMNVRLAMLRADQAQATADILKSNTTNGLMFAGNMLGAAESAL